MGNNIPKNIVLCSDGTGNSDVKGRGTNVFKLYEAIDIQGHKTHPEWSHQVAFYDDGVGTSDNQIKKILGGAFGWGFSQNVRKLYRELVRVYSPGDRIFVFGFSRGAYTVRTLAAFIQYTGVLKRDKFQEHGELDEQIKQCWKDFEKVTFGQRNVLKDSKPPSNDDAQEKARHEETRKQDGKRREGYKALIDEDFAPYGEISIEFIGVWDTVAAVGTPFKELTQLLPFWFKDLTLGPLVKHAYHALSIDDERLTFVPELWEDDERLEQVWFAGVHSNVGGGYPKHGMSLEALDWMMAKAEEHGLSFTHKTQQEPEITDESAQAKKPVLRFIKEARDYVRTARDVHSKLYDSRAGLAVYYRWQPRDIHQLCKDRQIDKPKIHVSVFERIAQGTEGYAPGNIPFQCEIVSQHEWPGAQILRDAESLLESAGKKASADSSSLLDNMKETIRLGQITYKAFLSLTIVTLLALFSMPALWGWIVLGAGSGGVLIWVWSSRVDAALEDKYSKFWSELDAVANQEGKQLSLRGKLRALGL